MRNFRVAGTVEGLEVWNVQRVEPGSARFPGGDEVEVIVNCAATHAARRRFFKRLHNFELPLRGLWAPPQIFPPMPQSAAVNLHEGPGFRGSVLAPRIALPCQA